MQIRSKLKQLSIKYASNQYYQRMYYGFLGGIEILAVDYIPLEYLVPTNNSSLIGFFFNTALGISLIILGVLSWRKFKAFPIKRPPLASQDSNQGSGAKQPSNEKTFKEISPTSYFWSEISMGIFFFGIYMFFQYIALPDHVYLFLGWIQTITGMAGMIIGAYIWSKIKKSPSPALKSSPS